ncbi:GDP-mannose mannosyl hydrolase [Glaciecola siphonariae]|uniref:GDP-mannose mannosyl hydrolase n=1 Tax=Glaciecola siphonariae TaxID=521012 RepID=A0ABV9LY94_9ALTE
MFLSINDFTQVIKNTPLVSLDLVITNSEGKALLGKRNNRPAKGFWFVPGGRIMKNEPLKAAFERLTKEELGQQMELQQAELIGPFDHFYDDCVFGESPSTHYVAIAYKLKILGDLTNLPVEQHNSYKWFEIDELLSSAEVHEHTKWYFKGA